MNRRLLSKRQASIFGVISRFAIRLRDERGVSIVGTVFAFVILGVMGATLVALVSTDQESRMKIIQRERAFYAMQAGLEYALREINEGAYPLAVAKPLGQAAFTVAIDPDSHRVTARGESQGALSTHSITAPLLGADCLNVDVTGAGIGGMGGERLLGIVLTRTCLNAVAVNSMTLEVAPDIGERVRRIMVGGVLVYEDLSGAASGEVIDVADFRVVDQAAIDFIEFSAGIGGKKVDLRLTLTDSSLLATPQIQL
jgi:hypothetical protein